MLAHAVGVSIQPKEPERQIEANPSFGPCLCLETAASFERKARQRSSGSTFGLFQIFTEETFFCVCGDFT